MQSSDDKHFDDGQFKVSGFRFRLRRLFVVMTIFAAVLAVVGYGIREASKPPLSEILRKELAERFPKGTPRAEVDKWLKTQNVRVMEASGATTLLQWLGLQAREASCVLQVVYPVERSTETRVLFYFDDDDQLIKFYVHEFHYSL
jgi:hypothetical protein